MPAKNGGWRRHSMIGKAAKYGSSWYDATSVAAKPRAPLTHDLDVDVCVVGGGLAGLTTAREIARRGWSVAVLEASQVAWNASGRNGGFVLPGFDQGVDRIIERVGLDHAKDLWALAQDGVDYVRATIRETGMSGVDPIAGWLAVSRTDDADGRANLAELLDREFRAEVDCWSTERVREQLRTDFYFQALHFPGAFHIHTLNYALGLAAAAERAGALIFERTPALEIDPAGVRKRIATPSARVRAGQVVLAGNAHIGQLVPDLARTLVPVTTYAAVTEPLGPQLAEAITYRGAISDSDRADHQYRMVAGDRLLWAGRFTAWSGKPSRRVKHFAREIARRYPQLGTVGFEHAWSGVVGVPVHRMPQIGEVSPGLWLASGFAGHGLNTTAMAGQLIARGMIEGDDTWRLFLPYGLVWGGGILGRSAVQIACWVARGREEAAGHLSRRREFAARRQAEAAAIAATPKATDHAEINLVAAPEADTDAMRVAAQSDSEPAGVTAVPVAATVRATESHAAVAAASRVQMAGDQSRFLPDVFPDLPPAAAKGKGGRSSTVTSIAAAKPSATTEAEVDPIETDAAAARLRGKR